MKLLAENAPKVIEKMQEVDAKENRPKEQSLEKYTLDHTIVVYLMGPQN